VRDGVLDLRVQFAVGDRLTVSHKDRVVAKAVGAARRVRDDSLESGFLHHFAPVGVNGDGGTHERRGTMLGRHVGELS